MHQVLDTTGWTDYNEGFGFEIESWERRAEGVRRTRWVDEGLARSDESVIDGELVADRHGARRIWYRSKDGAFVGERRLNGPAERREALALAPETVDVVAELRAALRTGLTSDNALEGFDGKRRRRITRERRIGGQRVRDSWFIDEDSAMVIGLRRARRPAGAEERLADLQEFRLVRYEQLATLAPSIAGQPDTQAEPSVAIDPRDPDIVVAVFQVRRHADGGAAANGYAASHDGGITWSHGILPGLSHASGGDFERASDPVVAFGPDGTVYAESLLVDPSQRGCTSATRTAVAVQRSTDGGLSFGLPALVQDDRSGCRGPLNDKPWIAVDTRADSPRRGRLYAVWTRLPGRLVERHSDDGGLHWSALRRIPFPGNAIGAIGLVGPGGRVTVVFDRLTPRCCPALYAISSPDGARTWERPRWIARMRPGGLRGIRMGPAEGFPAAAVDPADGALSSDGERRPDT